MNYPLAKSEGLKCFKAADYTNSNDFVNAVNDLLKHRPNSMQKLKELSRKWKGPKRYYIVIDELIALIASANKNFQHQMQRATIRNNSCNWALQAISLILIAQDWNVASEWNFNHFAVIKSV